MRNIGVAFALLLPGGGYIQAQEPTADLDRDGFTVAAGDCNDRRASIYLGAPESGNADYNCDSIIGSLVEYSRNRSSAGGLPKTADPILINVMADREYCATWARQCGETGHTPYPANQDNHNPVRLTVEVTRAIDGSQVTGLTEDNFTIYNPFVPAGTSAVDVLECSGCFQDGGPLGPGVYTLLVHPAVEGFNWKPGRYDLLVNVHTGESENSELVQIPISF